jgi:hypothetical protein
MNEVVFSITIIGLHGAAILAAVFIALRSLERAGSRHPAG